METSNIMDVEAKRAIKGNFYNKIVETFVRFYYGFNFLSFILKLEIKINIPKILKIVLIKTASF